MAALGITSLFDFVLQYVTNWYLNKTETGYCTIYNNHMEGPGSATIKSQASSGRGNPSEQKPHNYK